MALFSYLSPELINFLKEKLSFSTGPRAFFVYFGSIYVYFIYGSNDKSVNNVTAVIGLRGPTSTVSGHYQFLGTVGIRKKKRKWSFECSMYQLSILLFYPEMRF